MDTLSLSTTHCDSQNHFIVKWKWRQQSAKLPLLGEIDVSIDDSHQFDRSIIAEASAIYYLLETRQIHGENRYGRNITIETSSGAIRKSVLKGSVKREAGKGSTAKSHVAACVDLLATKYFEADVLVGTWQDEVGKSYEHAQLDVGQVFLRPSIYCHLLQRNIAITRHAIHRLVGRIDQRRPYGQEKDLSDISTHRWTASWQWLVRVLSSPGSNLNRASVRKEFISRIETKYGRDVIYLHFPDSSPSALLVVCQDKAGELVLETILNADAYSFIVKPPRLAGQKLVSEENWRN